MHALPSNAADTGISLLESIVLPDISTYDSARPDALTKSSPTKLYCAPPPLFKIRLGYNRPAGTEHHFGAIWESQISQKETHRAAQKVIALTSVCSFVLLPSSQGGEGFVALGAMVRPELRVGQSVSNIPAKFTIAND